VKKISFDKIPAVDLDEEVRKLVAQVPKGKVTTYGYVARALGDVVASRFVGKVMSENEDTVRVPCRRVVSSDGSLGGYTGGGPRAKKRDLRAEGVEIRGDKIVDFEKRLFKDFETEYPLRKFRRIQSRDSKKVILEDVFEDDYLLAGADVAYSGERAFGSLVLFDRKSKRMDDIVSVETETRFPYIPTYLSFRETPVVAELIEGVNEDIILVYDGNGILHPLGFGIASHIGVLLDLPTIGVAKKLLCGEVRGRGKRKKVIKENEQIGFSVEGDSWKSPVYISPGHRVSPESTLKVLTPFWKHRVPEPVRRAHIEANLAKRDTI